MDNVEIGVKEINDVKWVKDERYDCFYLTVHDQQTRPVVATLSLRPPYCDRGHIQLLIDGNLGLDWADSFPRFFFSPQEADTHVREFLKWRLWKHRSHPHQICF